MMKFHYRKACLKLHPDKGGNPQKMQRLNFLWQHFQESLDCLRNGEGAGIYSFQVKYPYYASGGLFTLQEVLGERLTPSKLLRGPGCKFNKGPVTCRCVTCKLNQQHRELKKSRNKPCLVWGECFCYSCYLLWFGFPETWESFDWWMEIIKQTEMSLLNLSDLCKYALKMSLSWNGG